MNEAKKDLVVNFGDAEGWSGPAGVGAGKPLALPFDGLVPLSIDRYEFGLSGAGNDTLKITHGVDIEDNGVKYQGPLYSTVTMTGEWTDSRTQEVKKNIFRFFNLLVSAGFTQEQISELQSSKKSESVKSIMDKLVAQSREGRRVYGKIKLGAYNGEPRTEVKDFASPEDYAKAETTGVGHRRTNALAGQSIPTASNGATAGTAAAPAADPMQSLIAG